VSKVYRARAKEWAIGQADPTKAPQISIMFQVIGGEADGHHKTYFGSFSEGATDFTLNAMRACGWSTDSLYDLAGMDANEVNLVAEDETYEGKTREKIKWVNRIASLKVKNQMTSRPAPRLRGEDEGPHRRPPAEERRPERAHTATLGAELEPGSGRRRRGLAERRRHSVLTPAGA
jgi:hypothetical protein